MKIFSSSDFSSDFPSPFAVSKMLSLSFFTSLLLVLGFGSSFILGGRDKGPLFSIKNSSVVRVFSFLKAFPASSKELHVVKRKSKKIKLEPGIKLEP